jgi:Ser/Thr protein kinase RdoA (MazF antagonist)
MNELRLLASGRAADVFDLADGNVLRRYRDNRDANAEARLMSWLDSQGYPVPTLREANGCELVMARIEGPTMFEVIRRSPGRVDEIARLLSALQRRLNRLLAPSWLSTSVGVPTGPHLLHLDLHPMNVLMSPAGPVVIDWTNASAGPAEFDVATTLVTMRVAELTDPADIRIQRAFVASFQQHCDPIEHRWIQLAVTMRSADPNTTQTERARLDRIRRAEGDADQAPSGGR